MHNEPWVAEVPANARFTQEEISRALLETIRAYETAIAKLDGGILVSLVRSDWAGYGEMEHCRFCRLLSELGGPDPDCQYCPLSIGQLPRACALHGFGLDSNEQLRAELMRGCENTRDTMTEAFKNRLRWIHTAAGSRGYRSTQAPGAGTTSVTGPDGKMVGIREEASS